ncbi:MAG: sulfatase [Alteromonadaceae bacterium]|nr:sulfatase [Alteromonadaceae bacterium]
MPNSPLKIFIIAILSFSFSAHAMTDKQERKSSKSAKPNIVFIAIDDMNDWVGYMGGHPQTITPNMDKLANDGVAFMNAHSVAPGCSPSRNALLYGVEPYNSGLYPFYEHEIHKQLKQKYTSLPTLLKNNGYNTYGAGKIHHGKEYGATEWTDYLKVENHPRQFAKNKGFSTNKKNSFRPTTNPYNELFDHQVASYGINVIKNNKKNDKPYFAAIGLVKPHLPFDCPEEFYDALPEKITPPALLANDLNDIGKEGNSMRRAGDDKKFTNNNQWGDVRKSYLSCISWADYNVGRIMEAVENSPQADNTIVILWSDHGFHLGEKKSFKKFTLWEEANRVPFIIHDRREKGAEKGRKVTQAVTLINVYRTLAEMAGLAVPEYVDGNSLVPQLLDQSATVLAPAIASWGRGNYAVRTENWRFIQYFNGEQELYNHQKDNNEWHNLALLPEYQSKVKELSALLPKNEAPTVEEYIADWSLFGADKKRLKKVVKNTDKNSKKIRKKQ